MMFPVMMVRSNFVPALFGSLCNLMQSLANLHGSINKILWRCCGWKQAVLDVNELLVSSARDFFCKKSFFIFTLKKVENPLD